MILVQHILEAARKRLAVLSREASLSEAAQILLKPNTPLVVVCDSDGVAVGLMSRTNIIKLLACAGTDVLDTNAGAIRPSPLFPVTSSSPCNKSGKS